MPVPTTPTIDDFAFQYTKQPTEAEIVGVNFTKRIPITLPVTTIDSPQVIVEGFNILNNDTLTPLVATILPTSGNIVSALISGGAKDNDYKVTFRITLSNNEVKEEDIIVLIREF